MTNYHQLQNRGWLKFSQLTVTLVSDSGKTEIQIQSTVVPLAFIFISLHETDRQFRFKLSIT